jgi:hypothetical protein
MITTDRTFSRLSSRFPTRKTSVEIFHHSNESSKQFASLDLKLPRGKDEDEFFCFRRPSFGIHHNQVGGYSRESNVVVKCGRESRKQLKVGDWKLILAVFYMIFLQFSVG